MYFDIVLLLLIYTLVVILSQTYLREEGGAFKACETDAEAIVHIPSNSHFSQEMLVA